MALAIALAAVGGLIVGSFLNVVVYRLPRHESLIAPALALPAAAARRSSPTTTSRSSRGCCCAGSCRHCGEPISARYPLVELTTGVLCAAVVATQDDAVRIVLGLLLVTALVPIALIDLEHRIIPNRLTGPAAIAAVIAIAALDPDFLAEALIAAAAAGGFFFIAALPTRAGWAWATSSSPACWACTSGGRWRRRSSSR